jgi:hypothetical protein
MTLDDNQKRILLFLFGCIPARLLIAFTASKLSTKNLKILAYIYLLVAIGMAYLALANKRLTGPETFGNKIWWTPHLRLVHASLYFMFFILTVVMKYSNTYVILYLDVLIGLIAFISHELF